MHSFKFNILFNLVGGAWLGLITLIATPVQLHILGVEAFGFISLIAILQIALSVFDLGLSATVTKLISNQGLNSRQINIEVVNRAGFFYWAIAGAIAFSLFILAGSFGKYIVGDVLVINGLNTEVALKIVALFLGLRWPIAFYTGVISGHQQMGVLNFLKISFQTIRVGGATLILFINPSLLVFLMWLLISSVLELICYHLTCSRMMPELKIRPSFSVSSFSGVWKYAGLMNLLAISALILSQADRFLVSRNLGLEQFGIYSVAYSASIVVSLIQSALNSASFPAYSHSYGADDKVGLLSRYKKSCLLMGLVVTMPCWLLIFFGGEILELWVGKSIAAEASTPMAWLSLGFYLNALVSSAYVLTIACNAPSIPLKINGIAIFIYIPMIFYFGSSYGLTGVAFCYAMLNLYYLFTMVPWVHKIVLGIKFNTWLKKYIISYILAATMSLAFSKILYKYIGINIYLSLSVGFLIYIVLTYRFILFEVQGEIVEYYNSIFKKI